MLKSDGNLKNYSLIEDVAGLFHPLLKKSNPIELGCPR